MNDKKADAVGKPKCFGNLKAVFPMTDSGLRETPLACMELCSHKTQCLRTAMAGSQGKQVKEELIERSDKAGMISFIERWSRKKRLHRNDG